MSTLREAAQQAQADPTDPGYEVEVLREHVRHLERRVRELRRLHAEVEDLKRTLAASCDEERSQLWEAGPGGGCARALSAEFRCAELLEALKHYADTYCEGWCKESCGSFDDCGGCRARAAIAKAEGA